MRKRRTLRVAVIVSLLAAAFVLLGSRQAYTQGPLTARRSASTRATAARTQGQCMTTIPSTSRRQTLTWT